MAARKRRKSTKRRKSSKRRKRGVVRTALSRISRAVKPKRKKPRTAAQKRATAKLVAMNRKRRAKKSENMLPGLPKHFRGGSVHSAMTVRPRSRFAQSHHPEAVTIRIKPRRDVGHEFYD